MMRFSLFANLKPEDYIIIRSYEKHEKPRGYDKRHLREIVKLKTMYDKVGVSKNL